MRTWKRAKRALAAVCCLAALLSMIPAAGAEGGPVRSRNKNQQDYTAWASTVKSYLYANEAGGLTRVEYTNGQVVIEDYDNGFRYQSGRTLSPELPVWGGFFAGEDYNFLIFGQNNPGESGSAEVIRVVKYDKDWNRLGQASLRGANTTVPFDAGSLRCDEYGGYLYIRTCHEMFKTSDGYNHQSNMMLAVREGDMTVTDSFYDIWNTDYGYISHSFNQFILVDEDGYIVTLDHGDASPRAVTFMRYYKKAGQDQFRGQQYGMWCSCGEMLTFAGQAGANITGGSVGGLAETSDCYIMAYNYDGQGGYGDRYPYYHWMDKATGRSWSAQLTQTPGSTTPVLAPTGLDGGYMLWNGKSGYTVNDTLYYLHYGADGQPEQFQTAAGSLSDCQPIYYNGKVVWYVTDNSAPVFYQLDASGVTAVGASSEQPTQPEEPTQPQEPTQPEQPTQPEEPTQPEQPSTPTDPISFSDVKEGSWYQEAVEKAAAAGLVNGMGDGTYHPYGQLTIAQALTLAYQLDSGSGGTLSAQDGEAWYMPYYRYCLDKGIITASQIQPSDLTRNTSRYEMVSILDKAIPQERMEAIQTVASIPDLRESAPYGGIVYKWYRAGILAGDEEGRFNGDSDITRAEVAVILCRVNNLLPPASFTGTDSDATTDPGTATDPETPSTPGATSLPADGRVDYYRTEGRNGSWMTLEVLNGDTVRFSGCVSDMPAYYNYAVLWVLGNQQEVPFVSGVPFSVEAKVDVRRLNELYGGDISQSTSYVTSMICQNHVPGKDSLAGISLYGAPYVTLALNGRGGCTLQVVER